MIDLVIDRTTWLRGELDSYLLRSSDNTMCCLGFLSCEVGYEKGLMEDQLTPSDISNIGDNKFPAEIVSDTCVDTPLTLALMKVNDNTHITERERELLLQDLFLIAGIRVSFIH